MTADFYLGQGDAPLYQTTLVDADGNAVLIQGATATLTLTPISGGTAVLDAVAMTNDDDGTTPQRGKVHYQFLAGASATWSGVYLAKITVTDAGRPITFPNDGFIVFEVGPAAATTQRRYLGVEELKRTLGLDGESFADTDIDTAIEAASRGLEEAYGQRWTTQGTDAQPQLRYYTAESDTDVALRDVLKATSVDLDYSYADVWRDEVWATQSLGGGTYSTPLDATSYRLLPIQSGQTASGGNGEPFDTLQLARGSTIRRLPQGVDAIRVTGIFGYEAVPAGVKAAVTIIATRLLRRAREAPWGIIAVGLEGQVVRAREVVRDPEVLFAMAALTAGRSWIV